MTLIKHLPVFLGKPHYFLASRAFGMNLKNLRQSPNPANVFGVLGPENKKYLNQCISHYGLESLEEDSEFKEASKKYGAAHIFSAGVENENPIQMSKALAKILLSSNLSADEGRAFLIYFELKCIDLKLINANSENALELLDEFIAHMPKTKNKTK